MLAVVRVDVVDLVYLLSKEACSVQRYPGFGSLEDTFHLQHDCIGDEAYAYVGLDSVEEPVVHRPDIKVGLQKRKALSIMNRYPYSSPKQRLAVTKTNKLQILTLV